MPLPESCRNIQDLLSDYLEGFLDGAGSGRVRDHLHRCAPCREALTGLEHTGRALKQADRITPSPGFKEAVRAKAGLSSRAPSGERTAFRWAALAASLIVGVTVAYRLKPVQVRVPVPVPQPPRVERPAPPPGLALAGFEGWADRLPAGGSRWLPLDAKGGLSAGDLLRTGKQGARLQIGEHAVPLPPGALIAVEKAGGDGLQLAYYAKRAELEQGGTLQVLRLLERDGAISLVHRDGSVGLMTEGSPEEAWSRLQEVGFSRPSQALPAPQPPPAPRTSKEF